MKPISKYYFILLVGLAFFMISCNLSNEKATEEKEMIDIKSVVVGEQTWSAENINISFFQNGDSIPEAKTEYDWVRAAENSKPVWSYYNFDKRYEIQYGKLYNWYAIIDPRGFAPKGWRVPSVSDWNVLFDNCGGIKQAANKLKVTGDKIWDNTNPNVTNQTKFSAVPGGFYNAFDQNGFWSIGRVGMWWASHSSTEDNQSPKAILISTDVSIVNEGKSSGLSVRLVTDKNIPVKQINPEGEVVTKVLTYKWCECNDGCASLFIDENGQEYNFGDPSTSSIEFDCSLEKISDPNKDRKFIVKYKMRPNNDYSILDITPIDNKGVGESSQYSSPTESDILDYLTSHSFTYEGNGLVTFSNKTVTVKGNSFTMIGDYRKISENSVQFNLRVVDGNFDASRNRTTYGRFTRNSDGSLTETLSDGINTKVYRLVPQ